MKSVMISPLWHGNICDSEFVIQLKPTALSTKQQFKHMKILEIFMKYNFYE